jgi:hypothetical protein
VAKKSKAGPPEHWKTEPEEHDFPAASDYLSLLFPESKTAAMVEALRGAATGTRKAKDLLRASGHELLPQDDPEVVKDLAKVAGGDQLSPVLLVRGSERRPLVIADGYHRICASYHLDENAEIPCRIVDAR